MQKIVTKGDRTAQVTLDGGECEVVFDSRYNFFSVEADNDVVVSLKSGKTADDDGVMICKGGGAIKYDHMKSLDRVYVTGSGKVQVVASNTSVENFKKARRGGDSGGVKINFVEYFGGIKDYEYIGTAEETEENT